MDYIEIQKVLAPELLPIIQRRYSILHAISHLAPVGRRLLAENLQLGERVIRSELDTLKHMGLVEPSLGGVSLSPRGRELLQKMAPYISELLGLPHLERQLRERLGIAQVVLVPGDSSSDPLVQAELGRAAARVLLTKIQDGDVIAITGGLTMSHVAESIYAERRKVTVVPGRGALGEKVEIQANTIAAKLAQGLGGNYRLLHAPDNLSDQALAQLARDPGTADVLALIHQTTILLHGIGDALEMARRREVPQEQIARLQELEAVSETLGYYFNAQGEIVWQANSIGLRLRDLETIKTVIAVAGGSAKARAIKAFVGNRSQHILITDQGAAQAILAL